MPVDLQRIHDRVLQYLFGMSPKGSARAVPEGAPISEVNIEAVNILNCIDECDRLLRKCRPEIAKVERKPIRSSYDFLSELVHPNGFAFMFHVELDGDQRAARFWPEGNASLQANVAGHILRALLILGGCGSVCTPLMM
jgi:hypothetical protein